MSKITNVGLGKIIRKRRDELGLTQLELAKRMGYSSKAAISRVENGDDNLTTPRIVKFAEALDTTPGYLMGWEDIPNSKEAGRLAAELIKDTEVLSRASKLHHASEADRETIFRVIDSILGN